MTVKNIVFDVGNVLVKWDPRSIVKTTFGGEADIESLLQKFYKSNFWYDLNLGKITEKECIIQYKDLLKLDEITFEKLLYNTKESLVLLQDTINIVEKLHAAGFPLYIITDNTREIMSYLKQKYKFWDKFIGIVVSAEIGHLKPSPVIYKYLLDTYQLNERETVFFDDVLANVEGAKSMNMHAFQFSTAEQCKEDLKSLNIIC